jgi:hypothetical protein
MWDVRTYPRRAKGNPVGIYFQVATEPTGETVE